MGLNLGQITFGLSANTSGLTAAVRNVQNFGTRVGNAVKASKGNMDEGLRALVRQEGAMIRSLQNLQNNVNKINSMKIAPEIKTDSIAKLERAYGDFVKRLNTRADRPLNPLDFQRATLGLKENNDAVNRWLATIRNGSRGGQDFISTMRGIGSSIELAAGPLNGFVFRIRAATELMSRYGVVAGATAGAVIGLGTAVFGLGSELIRATMEFQRANIMLTAVTGNSAVAAVEMDFVRKTANQAGLAFSQTAKDYARYSAAAKAAGTTTAEVRDQFQKMAMISGTLQLAQQDVSGVIRALEQIMSKGTVQSEELRGQLGDRMPAAFAIAAKAVGKTTEQLSDMLKKGQVISKDFVPAFLNAAVAMYNIDLAKPINSLQASLARLQSNWDIFLVGLDRATGASKMFQGFIDLLGRSLQYMTTHMNEIISGLVGIGGAIGGMLAAQGAIMVMPMLFQAWNTAVLLLNGGLRITTALMVVLNTIMTKTPIGKVISLLVTLAAGIVGAKLAYDAMNSALAANSAAMADTSAIDSYIRGQQQLGYNIRATTNDLIKQQNALAISSEANYQSDLTQMRNYMQQAGNLKAAIEGAIPGQDVANMAARYSEVTKKANELGATIKPQIQAHKAYADSVNRLGKLMALPDQPSTAPNPPGGKKTPGGKSPDPERGLESIRDMILEASKAQDMLDRLFAGPSNLKLIEDLYKVKDATDKLDPDQIAQMRKYLDMPNATLGDMQAKLVEFVTTGRQATETFREFSKVWDDIEEGKIALQGLQAQMQFLTAGGDPEKMYFVTAFTRAREALKSFHEQGEAGQAALAVLKDTLEKLGYSGETAEQALAQMFATMADGEDQVSRLSSAIRSMDDDLRTLGSQSRILANMKGLSISGILDLEAIEDARDALYGLSEDSLAKLSQRLNAMGIAGSDAVSQWAAMTRQIDINQKSIERHKQLLEDNKQAWVSLGQTAVDTLEAMLGGTKSLKDGLSDMLKGLAGSLWQVGVANPLKNWMSGLGEGSALASGAGLGGQKTQQADQNIGSLSSAAAIASRMLGVNMTQATASSVSSMISMHGSQMAQTVAMGQTTSSLFLLANAATAASMGLGGGGAGGFLAKAFNIVQSVISPGLDVMSVTQNVPGLIKAPIVNFPRAAGGPLTRGQQYRINEHGTNGDLFVPGQSGWANPNSPLTSQSSTIIIDASIGHIDARGATPDAIAQLRQEVQARDQRLRAELPSRIDARLAENQWRGR